MVQINKAIAYDAIARLCIDAALDCSGDYIKKSFMDNRKNALVSVLGYQNFLPQVV